MKSARMLADHIESDAKVIAALRERLECSEPWRAAGFGPAAEVAELRHRIEKLERTVRYTLPGQKQRHLSDERGRQMIPGFSGTPLELWISGVCLGYIIGAVVTQMSRPEPGKRK